MKKKKIPRLHLQEKKKDKEDGMSKILDDIKKNITNIRIEEESFQNKIAEIIKKEGYDEKLIVLYMINKSKPITNNLKKSICSKISDLLKQKTND